MNDDELATFLERVDAAGQICAIPLVGEYQSLVREEHQARAGGKLFVPPAGARGEAYVDLLACGKGEDRRIRWRAYVSICLGGSSWSDRHMSEGTAEEMLAWGNKKAEELRSWLATYLWYCRREAQRGIPNCPRSKFNPHGLSGWRGAGNS